VTIRSFDRCEYGLAAPVVRLKDSRSRNDAVLAVFPGIPEAVLLVHRLRACVVGVARELYVTPLGNHPEGAGKQLAERHLLIANISMLMLANEGCLVGRPGVILQPGGRASSTLK
jgi:hypothetical protein